MNDLKSKLESEDSKEKLQAHQQRSVANSFSFQNTQIVEENMKNTVKHERQYTFLEYCFQHNAIIDTKMLLVPTNQSVQKIRETDLKMVLPLIHYIALGNSLYV